MEQDIEKIISRSLISNELDIFSKDYANCRQKPIDTGSEKLNKMLGGGIFPGVTVLGAMPATGKSTLALQIATEVAESGTPVLFFSYEMSSSFITAKIISRYLNGNSPENPISTRNILNADVSDGDLLKTIPEAAETLKSSNLSKNFYIFDTSAGVQINSKQVIEIIDLFYNKFAGEHPDRPSPLVIIDYLQILAMLEKFEDSGSQVRELNDSVIRRLTFRAHDKQRPLAILIISAISRAHYRRSGNKKDDASDAPQMDVFKESGFIEYSADYALFLGPRTTKEKPNEAVRRLRLTVLKNRYGSINAYTDLDFYPAQDRFEEAEDVVDESDLLSEDEPKKPPVKNPQEKTIAPKKSEETATPSAPKEEAPAQTVQLPEPDEPVFSDHDSIKWE